MFVKHLHVRVKKSVEECNFWVFPNFSNSVTYVLIALLDSFRDRK